MSRINHHPYFNTEYIENVYTEKDGVPVRYVCTSALGGEEFAGDIFYRETPHPDFGNRYFQIYINQHDYMMLRSADKIEELEFDMVEGNNGWEYSQHRHHYLQVGSIAIDGGRAYTRLVGDANRPIKTFKVKNGAFVEL